MLTTVWIPSQQHPMQVAFQVESAFQSALSQGTNGQGAGALGKWPGIHAEHE